MRPVSPEGEYGKTLFDQLTAHAAYLKFEPGETITRQGRRGDAFFVLVSGRVDVVKTAEGGSPRIVSSIEAPGFLLRKGCLKKGGERPRCALQMIRPSKL